MPSENIQGIPRRISREFIRGPRGEEKFYLAETVYLAGGEGEYRTPAALNDETGRWKIKLEEAFSGETVLVRVAIL